MRQYQPIWEQIKANGFCDVSTHRAYHRRIIKAVTKEKDMDIGFKLECSERYPPVNAFLISKRSGSIISFRITIRPTITLESI